MEKFGNRSTDCNIGDILSKWSIKNECECLCFIAFRIEFQVPIEFQGHFYSRISNPTRDALQNCLAALEDAKYAQVFPTGCAALTAVLHLLKSGDHILTSAEQYGGSQAIFKDYVKIQGIELDFVDSADIDLFVKAIKPNTKVKANDYSLFVKIVFKVFCFL